MNFTLDVTLLVGMVLMFLWQTWFSVHNFDHMGTGKTNLKKIPLWLNYGNFLGNILWEHREKLAFQVSLSGTDPKQYKFIFSVALGK